ncbi:transporter substrate-binding domain-containing protein [Sphingobium sp. Sx8-8]|uniref:transporter substrate-binding domain-containing protein n=1 Tax=Sphingobium sp. Sx8-8 TaxID=2933617 RepID=UPI001F570A2C|nr:transporter substrate-binding domain-containing protein [Sphingobium sp. Sx8-8]
MRWRTVGLALPPLAVALAAAWVMLRPAPRSAATLLDSRPVITIGTEGAYPPWNFTRADGTLDGFEPELIRNLCGRAGLRCQMVAMDWDGMIGALHARKIDLIADSVQITPSRREVVAFTRPYAQTTGIFVGARDGVLANMPDRGLVLNFDKSSPAVNAAIARLRDALRGKVIGVEISGAYDLFINRYLKNVVTIKYYHTMGERDLDLLNGRLDVALEDAAYMGPLLATHEGAALRMVGPEVIGGDMGKGEALALRPDDHALKARFDAAIGAALADGTIHRLDLKWFDMDARPPAGDAQP